jgi:Na+(H+)/acetate symporter ActP
MHPSTNHPFKLLSIFYEHVNLRMVIEEMLLEILLRVAFMSTNKTDVMAKHLETRESSIWLLTSESVLVELPLVGEDLETFLTCWSFWSLAMEPLLQLIRDNLPESRNLT